MSAQLVLLDENADFGRFVSANEPIAQPSVVLSCKNDAAVVSDEMAEYACHHCLLRVPPTTSLLLCGGCYYAAFCGKECMTAAQAYHTIECGSLKHISRIGVSSAVRLMLRVMCLRRLGHNIDAIMDLTENREHFSVLLVNDLRQKLAVSIVYMENIVLDIEQALTIVLKIQCNAHSITDDVGIIGLGLYPLACRLNHSCDPNIGFEFLRTKSNCPPIIEFRALREIQSGEQLFYSYIDVYQPTVSRQNTLKSAYHFECKCKRCVSFKGDSVISGGRCVECDVTFASSHECQKSGDEFTVEDLKQHLDACQDILDMIPDTLNSDPKGSLARIESAIVRAKNLNPYNSVMFNAYNLASIAASKLSNYDKVRKYVELMVECMNQELGFISKRHPRTASLQQQLGETLVALGHIDLALIALRRCLKIRTLYYGEAHSSTLVIATMISDLGGATERRCKKSKPTSKNKKKPKGRKKR